MDYELLYKDALRYYENALRLEEQYENDFPERVDISVRKDSLLRKIDEVFEFIITSAAKAEEIQAYDMARQFYQRAVKLKPDSPVLQEFEARQDSINQLNN